MLYTSTSWPNGSKLSDSFIYDGGRFWQGGHYCLAHQCISMCQCSVSVCLPAVCQCALRLFLQPHERISMMISIEDENNFPCGFHHRHFIITFQAEYSDEPLYTYSSISAQCTHPCPSLHQHRPTILTQLRMNQIWDQHSFVTDVPHAMSELATVSLRVAHVSLLYYAVSFLCLCCVSLRAAQSPCMWTSVILLWEALAIVWHRLRPIRHCIIISFVFLPPNPPPPHPAATLPLHCMRARSRKSLAEKSPLVCTTAYFYVWRLLSRVMCRDPGLDSFGCTARVVSS